MNNFATPEKQLDSCLHVLSGLEGAERFDLLSKTIDVSLQFNNVEQTVALARCLEHEAEDMGNEEMAGLAIYKRIAAYFNGGLFDSVRIETPSAMAKCAKMKVFDSYFRIFQTYVLQLIYDNKPITAFGEVEREFALATKMDFAIGLGICHDCMGRLYHIFGDLERSEQNYLDAIAQFQRDGENSANGLFDVYFNFCDVLRDDKKYEECLRVIGDWEQALRKVEKHGDARVNVRARFILCYFHAAIISYKLRDVPKFNRYYAELLRWSDNGAYLGNMVDIVSMYASALDGNYVKAISMADAFIKMYRSVAQDFLTITFILNKSNFFEASGDYEQALKNYKEYVEEKEKVECENSLRQQNEFTAIYELEKNRTKQAELKQYLIYVYSLSALLLLFIVVIVFYTVKLHRRNHSLYEQLSNLSFKIRELDKVRKPQSVVRRKTLYERLEELMYDEKLFCNEDISLNKIAERLNSNRTYVSNCIRKEKDKSYSDYIADLRLEESLKIMQERFDYDMNTIASMVGYSSYSSFYRAFIKKYEVNPKDYRNFLIPKAKGI